MSAIEAAKGLKCWTGRVDPIPVKGGITNANFLVVDSGRRYFVRIGADIPIHGVMRFNEASASRAAATCGLSPELVHVESGALVFDFVTARTLRRICPPARHAGARPEPGCSMSCDMPKHVRGPVLIFWVFHILRDYAHSLGLELHVHSRPSRPDGCLGRARKGGRQHRLVFGHNDLLPTNLMDDGQGSG
jgi:hypothetical protein